MANEIIRPSELPVRTNPVPSEVVPSDNNVTVAGVSWEDGVNSAVPPASQSESEAGVINSKRMTPLTTKQAIDAQVDPKISSAIGALNLGSASQSNVEDFATAAQGALADSAVQPGNPALVPAGGSTSQVLIKSSNADYDTEWTTSAAATAVSYAPQVLTDEQKLQAQSNLSLANFKTVPLLLDDTSLAYAGAPGKVQVGPGDVIEAGGFRYEVAASDAADHHVDTAGGVKLYVLEREDGRVSPLQFGIVNGTDDTALLTTAFDHFLRISIPNIGQPWYVNLKNKGSGDRWPDTRYHAIALRDGHDVLFENGAEIAALGTDTPHYSIFHANRISDVVMRASGRAIIRGERDNHDGSTGEWGFGVSLYSCAGFGMFDIDILDCWGDGLYLGDYDSAEEETVPNRNVVLERVRSNNNRRQGLSIITVDGFVARDCEFNDTNGTLPESGVDIEPNQDWQVARNILFDHCQMLRNAGHGFISGEGVKNNGFWHFENCDFSENAMAGARMEILGSGTDTVGSRKFTNCVAHSNGSEGFGLRHTGACDIEYIDCESYGNEINVFFRAGCNRNVIRGGRYHHSMTTTQGIALSGNENIVEGADVFANGSNASADYVNISISGTGNLIQDCKIRKGSQTSRSAFLVGAAANNTRIVNNDLFDSGGTTDINIVGSPTGLVVAGNIRLGGLRQGSGWQGISVDANFNLDPRNSPYETRVTGALAANRDVGLLTTGAVVGDRFRVVRTATGSDLRVGSGPVKNLIPNTWAEFVYNGSGWTLSAYGEL